MSTPTRACPNCNTPLPGVAAFCYVCGTATPSGINRETGERLIIAHSGITPAALKKMLQRALGPGYELGERIGAGGFAEVFKARDLRLKRDIAVKVLRPDLGLTPGMLERFRREAEVVAALRHPNIVPIYDVGEAEGLAFIIMPFIAGESLRAKMEREGAMPLPEVRRILREAASGLGAAHSAGVIHRDVKPENIMLEGPESRVLLMDFGIAKAVGGDEDTPATEEGVAPALTSTGIIVGTPQYMSPEQACGDKTIDARTDQYSLAVVGYRMLSGTLPFEGESTRAVLYQQLVAEPAPLIDKVPGLPGGVVTAIQRAMAKEPRERFETMLEFAGMLEDDAAPVPLSAVERTKVAQAAAKTQSSQRRQLVMAV
ncbi:MAG: serine/threonine-protein kinase, partial [Gemmatimonadaceae bacterium]|nr:serine/threonine-protein kinase [Gemmatimonadaceae bacterium]